MGTPVPVLLMVRELGIGGCERDLTKLALGLDRNRFTPIVGCFRKEGIRAGELRAAGIRIAHFPVTSFTSLGALKQAAGLWRFLRSEGVAVVHSFDSPTNSFAMPVARLAGVPGVASRLWSMLAIPPRDRRVARWAEARARKVVTNSRFTLDEAAQDGIPRDRLFLNYNGLDTRAFHAGGRKRVPPVHDAELVIGAVCALRSEKRLDLLIDAFAAARQPGMRLLIVGSGPREADYKALVRGHQMESQVHFEPTRNDVAEWMRSMDVFVLSSETESFPNALLEAMACGCAVIGSRVGGVPEMISPESGELFEPGNPNDLTAKLKGLMDDPQRRTALGRAAALRAAQDFSMDKVAERMEGLYASLASAR